MTKRTSIILAVICGAGVLSIGGISVAQPPPPNYTVIVHARNPIEQLGRQDISALFLKQATLWGEARSAVGLSASFGSVQVEPVDQRAGSSVRALFSVNLLGRSVSEVESYWDRVEGGGEADPGAGAPPPARGPSTRPPALDSDAAVQEFVAAHPGAIGYVSGGARLIRGVKEVGVLPAR